MLGGPALPRTAVNDPLASWSPLVNVGAPLLLVAMFVGYPSTLS